MSTEKGIDGLMLSLHYITRSKRGVGLLMYSCASRRKEKRKI